MKRYEVVAVETGGTVGRVNPDGEWVKPEEAEEEIADLKEELLSAAIDDSYQKDRIKVLEAEIERLGKEEESYHAVARAVGVAGMQCPHSDDDCPAIVAGLEARPDEAKPRWRPIADAPRDGTRILGFDTKHGYCAVLVDEYGEWAISNEHGTPLGIGFYPTHYQPLPDPPEGV